MNKIDKGDLWKILVWEGQVVKSIKEKWDTGLNYNWHLAWTSIQNINYVVLITHLWTVTRMHKRIINFCTITSHKGEEIDWEGTIAVFEAVGSEIQSVYNYYI